MIDLYLDFDGVILDTITFTNNEIKTKGLKTSDEIHNYFENINWNELLKRSPVIKNSIYKINMLNKLKIYNISIITHYHSLNEMLAKDNFIKNNLPKEINVYYVNYKNNKETVVVSESAILVDDYIPNLESWEKAKGIGVKFSNTNKNCGFIKINDLEELIDGYEFFKEIINNKKIKIRNKE